MLVDGVTIKDGGDCRVSLCAAPIDVDNSSADWQGKRSSVFTQ
jgi:hypothetical protein